MSLRMSGHSRTGLILTVILGASVPSGVMAQSGTCTTAWSDRFNSPLIDGSVQDAVVWNDGTGPALYVAGKFQNGIANLNGLTPDTRSRGIMKWNGTRWSVVGPPAVPPAYTGAGYIYLTSDKRCVTTWDPDGAGPLASRLVLGGFQTSQGGTPIATFNGTSWTLLDFGCPLTVVNKIVEFQPQAEGPNLLVCAGYTGDGAAIVTFNPTSESWSVVGSFPGFDDYVSRMVVHDEDGPGPQAPAVFVAGKFNSVVGDVDSTGASGLAKWDGLTWSAVPGFPGYQRDRGTYFGNGGLTAIGSFDTGDGPSLWVGGVREGTAEAVYRFRNNAWEKMYDGQAYSFAMFDAPGGPRMHIAGAGALIRALPGGGWEALGQPVVPGVSPALRAIPLNMTVADLDFAGPRSPSLVLCTPNSNFYGLNIVPTGLVWDGGAFDYLPIGSGGLLGMRTGKVRFKEIDSDAGGPLPKRLMVFGDLDGAGRKFFPSECVWFDGTDYQTTPPYNQSNMAGDAALSTGVNDVEVYDDGSGPAMYATVAQRYSISDDCRSALVRLNASSWDDLVIASLGDCTNPVELQFLIAAPVNGQNSLIVTGMYDRLTFTGQAQPLSARGCARLTGTQWAAMDAGLPNEPLFVGAATFNNQAYILVSESGSGVNRFDTRLMRWNGTTWEIVGGAFFDHGANGVPEGMRVLDLGSGPGLYVFGSFSSVGGVAGTAKIARWNGQQWSPVSSGLDFPGATVRDLAAFNFGAGLRLAALAQGSSLPANLRGLVRLEGTQWVNVDPLTTSSPPTTLFGTSLSGAAGLYVSGYSTGTIGGFTSYGLTRLTVTCSCRADFNASGSVTVQDIFDFLTAWFSNAPSADFNGAGGVTVQDIFDFLAAWFTGCA